MQEAEGKEAREATAASVCFGIESKQLAFPVRSACILYRPAVLGERHGCTPVLSTHHLQVDTEELHHSGTSV